MGGNWGPDVRRCVEVATAMEIHFQVGSAQLVAFRDENGLEIEWVLTVAYLVDDCERIEMPHLLKANVWLFIYWLVSFSISIGGTLMIFWQ